uniref:Uncharacterized protein n=1 Tax=Tanacetum cinerariifolium TaxID=118510 RepID=A0A6L2JPC6_TANCI|nr:hypothetical protein [Tanacetum cinerariifolium]
MLLLMLTLRRHKHKHRRFSKEIKGSIQENHGMLILGTKCLEMSLIWEATFEQYEENTCSHDCCSKRKLGGFRRDEIDGRRRRWFLDIVKKGVIGCYFTKKVSLYLLIFGGCLERGSDLIERSKVHSVLHLHHGDLHRAPVVNIIFGPLIGIPSSPQAMIVETRVVSGAPKKSRHYLSTSASSKSNGSPLKNNELELVVMVLHCMMLTRF